MGKNSKQKKTSNKKSDETEFFIPRFTIAFALIFFLIGAIEHYCYKDVLKQCTAEVSGVVAEEHTGHVKAADPVADKYLSRSHGRHKYWNTIKVNTDSRFVYDTLRADGYTGRKGDTVIIHYDPHDPDEYYINDYVNEYRTVAILFYILGGINIVLSVYLTIHYNKPSSPQKGKAKKKKH